MYCSRGISEVRLRCAEDLADLRHRFDTATPSPKECSRSVVENIAEFRWNGQWRAADDEKPSVIFGGIFVGRSASTRRKHPSVAVKDDFALLLIKCYDKYFVGTRAEKGGAILKELGD